MSFSVPLVYDVHYLLSRVEFRPQGHALSIQSSSIRESTWARYQAGQ